MEKYENCEWEDLFTDDEMLNLNEGYILTGFLSIVFGLWLNLSIILTDLWHIPTYKNLCSFTLASLVRRMIAVIPHLGIIDRSDDSQTYCNIFGFLDHFLTVFEVEALTHICIERYVITKYVKNGWELTSRPYTLFKCLCFFFATLYSSVPFFGIGAYGPDFSCTSCTFDMVLPPTWQKFLIVSIFLLRSIKPTFVMLIMLLWSNDNDEILPRDEHTDERMDFSLCTLRVTIVNLMCWTSILVIRAHMMFWQITLSRLVLDREVWVARIQWALWLEWVAPVFTVMMVFIGDKRIRNKMLLKPNPPVEDAQSNDEKNK